MGEANRWSLPPLIIPVRQASAGRRYRWILLKGKSDVWSEDSAEQALSADVNAATMKPIQLSDLLEFSSERFFPRLVYGSQQMRAFLLCLEPDQGLPARQDGEEVVCCLLEGEADFICGDEAITLGAGGLAAAAPGQVRGIEARKRTVALWLQVSGKHE